MPVNENLFKELDSASDFKDVFPNKKICSKM